MKNKVTLAISTLVLCSAVTTAEASKHHSLSKHAKHSTASAHKTSHHSKHHSRHSHHIAHNHHRFHDVASSSDPHSGMASLYSTRFQGRKTASGEPYDMFELTAAHRTLPLNSYAEVTNLENNQTVVVRINDRGPFYGNRVLDLSTAAAEELGIEGGAEKVKITPLAMNDVIEDE
jgi:rare lipoprotein A